MLKAKQRLVRSFEVLLSCRKQKCYCDSSLIIWLCSSFQKKKNTSTRFCHLKTMIPRLKSSSEEEAFRKSFQGLSAGASVYTAHLIYKTAFLCCYITSPHSHSTKTHTSSNTSSTPVVLYLQPAVPLSTACFSQRLLRSAPLLIIDWPSTPPDHDLSIILTPFLQQLFSWFWD